MKIHLLGKHQLLVNHRLRMVQTQKHLHKDHTRIITLVMADTKVADKAVTKIVADTKAGVKVVTKTVVDIKAVDRVVTKIAADTKVVDKAVTKIVADTKAADRVVTKIKVVSNNVMELKVATIKGMHHKVDIKIVADTKAVVKVDIKTKVVSKIVAGTKAQDKAVFRVALNKVALDDHIKVVGKAADSMDHVQVDSEVHVQEALVGQDQVALIIDVLKKVC